MKKIINKKIISFLLIFILVFLAFYFIRIRDQKLRYQENINERIEEFKQKNPKLYNNLIDALKKAEKDLKKDPKNYNAWVDKGIILQAFGDYIGAEKAYLEALKISKLARVAWNNLGSIYFRQKNYKKALWAYKNLIKYFPTDTYAYVNIFNIYAYNLNDEKSAVDFIKKATELFKGQDIVFTFKRNLAEYYESKNKIKEALDIYKELLIEDNKNKDYYKDQINILSKKL